MTLGLPLSTLFAFLFVLARVAGVLAFLPIPMLRAAPVKTKVALGLALTVVLFPLWPQLENRIPLPGELVRIAAMEAAFGLTMGVAISMLLEGFQLAMQIIGLQAGYGYSLTIDPASQADSGVLQVAFSLITGLLIFVLGIDRELIRILAASLAQFPPGTWTATQFTVDAIIDIGTQMTVIGVRLAFPIAALLLLIDIALALLGRMQQQLQLITLAFPIKMLVAIVMLALIAPVFPRLFQEAARETLQMLRAGMGL